MTTREGTCYLQVVGYDTRSRWDNGLSLTVVRSTQTKPTVVEPGAVVVKIRVRMPSEAFKPLEPSAVVDVPLELVQHELQVVAVDGV